MSIIVYLFFINFIILRFIHLPIIRTLFYFISILTKHLINNFSIQFYQFNKFNSLKVNYKQKNTFLIINLCHKKLLKFTIKTFPLNNALNKFFIIFLKELIISLLFSTLSVILIFLLMIRPF